MIQLYAYYNHGGYKDLYLGEVDEAVESKYLITLYDVYKEWVKENPTSKDVDAWRAKLEQWDTLSQISVLYEDSDNVYPLDASIIVTYAGYKIILKRLSTGVVVLSVRDIPGPKDEYGRPSPFNLMYIANTPDDVKKLCALAEYIRENLDSYESFCATLFEYDAHLNAQKFHFGEYVQRLNEWIQTYNSSTSQTIPTKPVFLFVVPKNIKIEAALNIQKLSRGEIERLYDTSGKMYDIPKPSYTPESASVISPRLSGGYTWSEYNNEPLEEDNELSLEQLQKVVIQLQQRISELEKQNEALTARVVTLENKQ